MVAGMCVSHWNENSLIIFQGLSAVPGAGPAGERSDSFHTAPARSATLAA